MSELVTIPMSFLELAMDYEPSQPKKPASLTSGADEGVGCGPGGPPHIVITGSRSDYWQ